MICPNDLDHGLVSWFLREEIYYYIENRLLFPIDYNLSYDISSGSEITPCGKIDKQMFGKCYEVHINNVAYIMTKL